MTASSASSGLNKNPAQKHSLQVRLSKMLALAVLVTGIATSLAALYYAYDEAQEFQDATLRQVAALTAHLQISSTALSLARHPHDAIAEKPEHDDESLLEIYHLPMSSPPVWLPNHIKAGFHTLINPIRSESIRVFVRDTGGNTRLVVAQSTQSRNEIAWNSALRTLTPSLLMLPILVALIAFIVRAELKSLKQLSKAIDHQSAQRVQALPIHKLPGEVVPFVEAINRLLLRVDKLVVTQRRFIADAAHELRTPLTALSLQAQNLAAAKSIDDMHERLVPLQAGIERARKLTVQLLDLARIQAGGESNKDIDLAILAREWLAEFIPLAEARQIDLGMDELGSMPIHSDAQALGLIVRNALENALKYTPTGGDVTLRLRAEADDYFIEVLDTGPGIPTEKQAAAFAPFHRLQIVTGEGSGLGLAIAREAADKVGGQVTIGNRINTHGLVFVLRLPRTFQGR